MSQHIMYFNQTELEQKPFDYKANYGSTTAHTEPSSILPIGAIVKLYEK